MALNWPKATANAWSVPVRFASRLIRPDESSPRLFWSAAFATSSSRGQAIPTGSITTIVPRCSRMFAGPEVAVHVDDRTALSSVPSSAWPSACRGRYLRDGSVDVYASLRVLAEWSSWVGEVRRGGALSAWARAATVVPAGRVPGAARLVDVRGRGPLGARPRRASRSSRQTGAARRRTASAPPRGRSSVLDTTPRLPTRLRPSAASSSDRCHSFYTASISSAVPRDRILAGARRAALVAVPRRETSTVVSAPRP